jgi:hypothetical protein
MLPWKAPPHNECPYYFYVLNTGMSPIQHTVSYPCRRQSSGSRHFQSMLMPSYMLVHFDEWALEIFASFFIILKSFYNQTYSIEKIREKYLQNMS